MLQSQVRKLHEAGLSLLEKALVCGDVRDIQTFTELGLKCLAESRSIFEGMRLNSAHLFLEICAQKSVSPESYSEYLDFCARNGLEIISEQDFVLFCNEILKAALEGARG